MLLKGKFKLTMSVCATVHGALAALAWLAFVPAASAQLRPDDRAEPHPNSPTRVGSTSTRVGLLRYRDGGEEVVARRVAGESGGLARYEMMRIGRIFEARVGAEAVVQLAAGVAVAELARLGLSHAEPLSPRLGIFRVRGRPGEDGVAVAARLAHEARLASAVPDLHIARRRAAIDVPPDDPRYSAQWYLEKLDIERAWQLSTGDRDTSVVVIDGGCDMDHPDLATSFLGGRDLVDGDDDPSPLPRAEGNAHGTACAGIIAAAGDNGIGIAGVCPECALHCVRLYGQDDKALVPISADIAAFDYAFDVGAAVVSNSWGFADPTPVPAPLRASILSLIADGRDGRGTVVVFAAGNENRELGDDELVAVGGVLNIGAINNFDEAAPFSNFGASLDLTAPTATFTTDIAGSDGDDPSDYTSLFGGTSSACPVVAGAAALVLSAAPELHADEAAELLIATARKAPYAVADARGHDETYGYGIVDPGAAVRAALGLPEDDEDPPPPAPDGGRADVPDAGPSDPDAPSDSGCAAAPAGARDTSAVPLLLALLAGARVRARTGRRDRR